MLDYKKHVVAAVAAITLLTSIQASSPPRTAAAPHGPLGYILPLGFIAETLVTGLDLPTTAAWSKDGRLFIAQKGGRVRVFAGGLLQPQDFIDLSAEVNAYWDRGLLGLAVHPDFPAQPYIYLLYTYDPPGVEPDGAGSRVSRLIRVTANPDNPNAAQPGSAVVVLGKNSTLAHIGNSASPDDAEDAACEQDGANVPDCIPADNHSHTVGDLEFAPDGSLLVSAGEAAAWYFADRRSMRAQDLTSLAGKVLRIDPDTGHGLPDNPFFDGDPDSNRSKVWSYGLRNPFRLALAPGDAQPFVGDVGQNAWEELNHGEGRNFGWPCYEGPGRFARFETDPVFGPQCMQLYAQGAAGAALPALARSHADGDAAIIAGDVYSGTSYPAEYDRALFFGDYGTQIVRYAAFDAAGAMTVREFASGDPVALGGIVDVKAGPDTNIHLVVLDADSPTAGRIVRMRYIGGGNAPPVASLTALPTNGAAPLTVRFTGLGSQDPEAGPLAYAWQLGDGATSTAASFSHTYAITGTYAVTLTVADAQGATHSDFATITVGNHAPDVAILTPHDDFRYSTGDVISFTIAVTDVEDGAFPPLGVSWRVLLHHGDHAHPDFASGSGPSGAFLVTDHGDDTWLELCATAVDSGKLSSSRCTALLPRLTPVEVVTVPAGLRVLYNGEWRTAPFTAFVTAKSRRTASAPAEQLGCPLQGWSDGAPASRTIEVGLDPLTYTARYGSCAVRLPIVLRDRGGDFGGEAPMPPPGTTPVPLAPP